MHSNSLPAVRAFPTIKSVRSYVIEGVGAGTATSQGISERDLAVLNRFQVVTITTSKAAIGTQSGISCCSCPCLIPLQVD